MKKIFTKLAAAALTLLLICSMLTGFSCAANLHDVEFTADPDREAPRGQCVVFVTKIADAGKNDKKITIVFDNHTEDNYRFGWVNDCFLYIARENSDRIITENIATMMDEIRAGRNEERTFTVHDCPGRIEKIWLSGMTVKKDRNIGFDVQQSKKNLIFDRTGRQYSAAITFPFSDIPWIVLTVAAVNTLAGVIVGICLLVRKHRRNQGISREYQGPGRTPGGGLSGDHPDDNGFTPPPML